MLKEYAPSKINLFLDILSRRPDGYHDLGTLFQTVDVGDMLSCELDSSGVVSLRYNTPQDYPLEADLVYRAALLLKEHYSVKRGASLFLEKKMPLGAGLGGGSADAAAALRLLNKLWGIGASLEELAILGARLGADVPFLVRGGSALAEGIGDKLTQISSIELPKNSALLIATPLCAVPTKAAYAGCKPSGNARWEAYKASDYRSFGEGSFNKFEESVLPQFPLIAEMKKNFLNLGAEFSLMSGSGASVFGFFNDAKLAEKASAGIAPSARFVAVTRFFPGFFA